MQFSLIQQDVRDRLTILSTSTLITTANIKTWLNQSKDWALIYKKWAFLQKKETDLVDATEEYPYPSGMRTTSIYLIRVNSERYIKINHEDYLKYLEDHSTGDDRVWAEFDRTIYINGNACTVGETIEMYGQEKTSDLSDDDDTTPFADGEPSGDEAIIKRAVSIGLKKIGGADQRALIEEKEAKDILDTIWTRIKENSPRTVRKGRPLFKKINILKGTINDTGQDTVGKF